MTNSEKALFIMSKTNNGDKLSPKYLELTEMAINEPLSDIEQKFFEKLYNRVVNGYHKKLYFHDIEFMTRDHLGYVYFKEDLVEHYTKDWADTLMAKAELVRLQYQCLFLESIGKSIDFTCDKCCYSMGGAHGLQFGEHQKAKLDMRTLNNSILYSKVYLTLNEYEGNFIIEGHCDMSEIIKSEKYKDMCSYCINRYQYELSACRIEHLSYGNGEARNADETELTLIHSNEDYLLDKKFIKKHNELTISVKSEQTEIYDNEMEER